MLMCCNVLLENIEMPLFMQLCCGWNLCWTYSNENNKRYSLQVKEFRYYFVVDVLVIPKNKDSKNIW